jgi:ribosomal protein S21
MVNFKIIPEPFETLDSILKRCKKAANQCGLFEDYKSHQAFETPSARRRQKALRARLRQARSDKKSEKFARLKGGR